MGTTHLSGLEVPEAEITDLTVTDINGAPYVAGGGSPGNNKIWYTNNAGDDVGISNSIINGFPLVSNGGTTAPSYSALMGIAAADPGLAVGVGNTSSFIRKWAQFVYDFAADGGAVGDTTLALNFQFPVNSAVLSNQLFYRVLTTCTSAGDLATIGFSLVTDSSPVLVTAAAIGAVTNPWDAGMHYNVAPSAPALTTGARQVQVTIGVENVTAGKIQLFVPYLVIA